MNIKEIEIFAIKLPLIEPFVISYATYNHMPSIIVKITTDNGLVGYGEGVPDEYVTGETFESTFHVLKSTLSPILIGENPFRIEYIHDLMNKLVKNVPTAKAAVDIACYDLMGRALNVPVYKLLGGRYHSSFSLAHVLSIDTPDKMVKETLSHIKKGYRIFKMKLGTEIKEDVKRIQAVTESVDDRISIRIDINQGWETSATTLQALSQLENASLDWLEQPVLADDIDAMVEIKSKSSLPLMVDEGLLGVKEMREIIRKRAADKVNIKLMKCGGIYPATKLAHMAEMVGMTCQIGSMVESSVASAAGYQLAFSKKIITSTELTGPLKFKKDIGDLSYEIPNIRLDDRVGLGITVDEGILSELTDYSTKIN